MRDEVSTPSVLAYQLLRGGRLAEALPLAQTAIKGSDVCTRTHGMLATILCGLGRAREAEETVSSALRLGFDSADACDALAHVSITLGKAERARALYQQAVELEPHAAQRWYNLASSERSLGHQAAAEEACNRAIALDRLYYPSYVLRSELRVQTASDNHVAQLRSVLATLGSDSRGRISLGYALAKELDDLEHYDEAFSWFSAAARARRSHLSYDVSADVGKLRRIAEVYPERRQASPREAGSRYIFIVGLPRSGTTLLERILTGLPNVRTHGETDHFARALLGATPPGQEDIFSRAANADSERVARAYEQLAASDAQASFVIEKLPLNYLYLGAIQRALPYAKLIWMRRTPLDSCFAMYRTMFGSGYPFSYDFDDLARYYAAHERLMYHWRASLGTALYEVNYEDLVQQPQAVGSAVAGYCGCEWQSSAIKVEDNESASFTASASQVRSPIYRTSVGKWRHYSKHLRPLAQKLEASGVNIVEARTCAE